MTTGIRWKDANFLSPVPRRGDLIFGHIETCKDRESLYISNQQGLSSWFQAEEVGRLDLILGDVSLQHFILIYMNMRSVDLYNYV